MPPKRNYRKRRPSASKKKRSYKRKNSKITTMTTKGQLVCADQCYVKFRYVGIDTTVFPTSITPVSQYTFYLNGLYDIDPALATTDIPGVTAWSTLYQNYRAINATIKATFSNVATGPMYYGMLVQAPDNPLTLISWGAARETLGNKWARQCYLAPNGSGSSQKTLTMKVNFGELLGDPKLYASNLNYRGLLGSSNPTNIFRLTLYVMTADGTGSFGGTTPFSLVINYDALLANRELMF